MAEKEKVEVEEIIGLVKTDEPTDSVEEVRKLRGREGMTTKRFHFGYVLGDTGLIDEQAEHKWFIENCCSITDLKKNWKTVCAKLNEVADENEQLKQQVQKIHKLIDSKIQSARELGSVRTVIALKNLQRELNGNVDSLCIDCRHQRGTWVNDREVDTWCAIRKTNDCDETFECDYFEGL